jgi:hypothetical protein
MRSSVITKTRPQQTWFVVIATSLFAGCSGNSAPVAPATSPVTGKVTLKGKPAAGIVVTFHSQPASTQPYQPIAESAKDGSFTVRTGPGGNGAPPGDYVITFARPRIVSDRKHSGLETEIDDLGGRFSDPTRSQHKVTVVSGDNKLPPFALE